MSAGRTFAVVGAIVGVGVWGWFAGQHDAAVLAGPVDAKEGRAMAPAGESPADRLRAQLRAERAQLRAARRDVARWRAALRSTNDVANGIRLAARAFDIDEGWLMAIATCESQLQPGASNGPYVGLMQFGPALWGITPFKTWRRTDPYAVALAAAWAIDRGLASHWACA